MFERFSSGHLYRHYRIGNRRNRGGGPLSLSMLLTTAACMTFMAPAVSLSQPVEEVTANPAAQQLRQIWRVTGGEFGGGEVGAGFGPIGDVNGDGIQDFAVYYGTAGQWRIYYGSKEPLDTAPVAILNNLGGMITHPVIGDFWGTGHKALGFARTIATTIHDTSYYDRQLVIFRTDSSRVDTQAVAVLDGQRMDPITQFSPREILGADLDGDGADELIMFLPGLFRNGVPYPNPEIWIYRGGPGFQVDTPTVILRDDSANFGSGSYTLIAGHFDNDPYPDLMARFKQSDGSYKMSFWFGAPGSPWNWSQHPDRTALFGGIDIAALDCDGDNIVDLAFPGPAESVSLFLSRSGKNMRNRPINLNDADLVLHKPGYTLPLNLGYLSDSSRRYAMLGLLGPGITLGFSGGPTGPDGQYDATSGTLGFTVLPLGDVTGDGWNDLIDGDYTDNFNSGYAAIYAGGPYIPHDPSSGVEQIAVAGRSDAISTWPNPLSDQLYIAWRGDLPQMPERFQVHDLLGRLITDGHLDTWRGESLWQCADVAPGIYLLSIFDHDGHRITTHRLIKD
jgi:hypothetical protein